MGKGNVLVFLRVSTEVQDLENQKIEMRDFVKSMGYDNIIYIEGKGASAIKISDEYIEMYEEVKQHIINKDIDAVAVWAVNRLARSEEWFVKFKNLFIENKIQFIVKNPTLCLLNEDGSVNAGSELALSLFSTMSKQEMQERKEKFKRTKKTYAAQGKYVGGHSKKYGYKVDENNFFVVDEEESAVVKLVFDLYSTGEYSAYSLAKELNSRGYTKWGKPLDRRFISNIIQSQQYTGLPDEKWNNRVYPPIISVELFKKCRDIANGNKLVLRQGKKMVLCSRLIKCPECGHTFTSKSKHFRCNYVQDGCSNGITIKESVINEIAWRVALKEHMDYLIEVSENDSQKYQERLEVIELKIKTLNNIIDDSDKKKKRIIDSFIEGYIDLKERDLRLKKIQDDIVIHQKEINALEEEKRAILGLLDNVNKDLDEWLYYDTLDAVENMVKTDADRYKILHQHIVKILPSRCQYGKNSRDKYKSKNAILFEIYTVKGEVKKFIYLFKHRKGDNLFTYHDDKDLWLGEKL